ncbi:eIF2A-related protein [Streptomyces sp. CBMA156]|uniref:nSTAND1 domain-containing NTPase n=1 Tax=Streptomyces sp. CBMA156 TaxID=1930280 RepID=UPI001661CE7F|nr:trypsin-like peptidase domain-containing protein [Streptomyces sp. CBMA156]MBD0670130.1 hypothetical protein [Streptomyces sp. CBMA156]
MTAGRGTLPAGAGDGLAAAVAQVRDGDGLVVGAGFLVEDDLLVTCAHVLEDGGYGPGAVVTLVFPRAPGAPEVTGRVLEEAWRDAREQDVALVRLEHPVGVERLQLGSAAGARGHRVRSFGFPVQAPPGGHLGFATAGGILPDDGKVGEVLQLTDANDLTQGFSGGPVLDEVTGLVVGMLTAITAIDGHHRGHGIAYVTPTSVLREVWPALGENDVSPYRALEPFTAEHARWFRGRENAVRQVLEGLRGGQRVVLLLGPSGSGKSSLVQAGVLPALTAGSLPGSDRWRQVLTRPGPDLPGALTRAGLPGSGGADAAGRAAGAPPESSRVVLVVDQFEELLAPSAGPEARQTLARITAAIRSDAPLSVVLVMRDDFYSRLSTLAPDLLDTALQRKGVLNVPATLSAADLDAIVTGPAHDLDTAFEPGLAEQIITDVLELSPGAGGAPVTVLPLLEVALTRLWERRLAYDGRLTHDAYRRIGAVTGALTDWCDTALRELDPRQRDTARGILTALVRPADASLNIPAARQQLPLGELRDLAAADTTPEALRAVDDVLAVLSRHRIVTTYQVRDDTRPAPAQDAEGTAVAELVHDALIRDWDTLRDWVEQDLRFHDWLHRARQQHVRWQEHRDPQDLPSGTLLAEGTDWSNRRRLPGGIDDFLKAGRHRQQAAARRSRRLNTILATVLTLALIAAGIALWQRQTAVTAQQTAQSRQLAAQSASLIATDPDLAALLAVAAYRTSRTAEAAAALSNGANLPLRHRLASHTGVVNAVAFSPDGHTLATGDDHTVRLWDVATGKTTTTLTDHTDTVNAVAFSPDGHTLATGDDHTVRLWDVATGKTTTTLTDHTDTVNAVAFSPDGHTLATAGGDHTVRLWDVATGKTTTTLTDHTDTVNAVAFSPDGHTLATAGYDRTVRLWDVATGKTTTTLTGHTGPVNAVAFSPDGHTLATAGGDDTVRLWDVATGKTTTTLTDHTDTVNAVAFSPDGHTLATAGGDDTVRLWDVATGKTTTTLTGHTGPVFAVAFSPDGHTLATGGYDHTVRLWDVATGRTITALTGHIGPVNAVAFSPDGHTLATGGYDHTVRLWDVAAIRTVTTFTGHIGPMYAVAFSPDGHTLATGSGDRTVRLWDVATGKTTTTLTGHTGSVHAVAFSPDGHTLATGDGDSIVRLWDVATGKTTTTLTVSTDTVYPVRFSSVHAVAFSPDGHTLATAGADGTVRLWDVATGKTTTTFTGHTGFVYAVAFSPDGHTLATGDDDHTVRLWDMATGKTTTTTLTGHTGPVKAVAFSLDGHTLATAGADGTVRLWDMATGKTTTTLTGHTGPVFAVAFSPDGHTLATGGNDSTVRLWFHTAPDTAISEICSAVDRGLTPEEKQTYLPATSEPVCRS